MKRFENRDELNAEICRRARAVLGFRGYRHAGKMSLNLTSLRDRIPLELTDDRIAECAQRVADDTIGYL